MVRKQGILRRAQEEMAKLKDKILGKLVERNRTTGEVRIYEDREKVMEEGEEEIRCEDWGWMEEEDEIEITVEIKDKEPCGESTKSSQTWEQYSYLGDLEEVAKEQDRG
jgi:hypothetical protein